MILETYTPGKSAFWLHFLHCWVVTWNATDMQNRDDSNHPTLHRQKTIRFMKRLNNEVTSNELNYAIIKELGLCNTIEFIAILQNGRFNNEQLCEKIVMTILFLKMHWCSVIKRTYRSKPLCTVKHHMRWPTTQWWLPCRTKVLSQTPLTYLW